MRGAALCWKVAFLSKGFSLGMTVLAQAAEPSGQVPKKAPTPSDYWSGLYVGAHLGHAWGRADVTASEVGGGVTTSGTFSVHNPYDAFSGTGSYFGGLQAGYNK